MSMKQHAAWLVMRHSGNQSVCILVHRVSEASQYHRNDDGASQMRCIAESIVPSHQLLLVGAALGRMQPPAKAREGINIVFVSAYLSSCNWLSKALVLSLMLAYLLLHMGAGADGDPAPALCRLAQLLLQGLHAGDDRRAIGVRKQDLLPAGTQHACLHRRPLRGDRESARQSCGDQHCAAWREVAWRTAQHVVHQAPELPDMHSGRISRLPSSSCGHGVS